MSARPLLVLALAAATVGCSGSSGAAAPTPTPLQRELTGLPARMDALHPDVFHATPRSRFRAQAQELARRAPGLSRPQLVVGLMRILALAGNRDGHTGIYPLDQAHARPLRLYPLRLYDFAEGLHVVGAIGRTELVGRRVTAIGGVPIARVVQQVRPLVPHDNASSRRWLLPEYVVTYEVLRGLGIVPGERATFAFADGSEVELEPVSAGVAGTLGGAPAPLATTHDPVWLRRLEERHWLTTLDGGRSVYLAYRVTQGDVFELSERLLRLARRPQVRRVVVDVRLNHGGDNTTYGSLLDALQQPAVNRRGRLFVLIGRGTFSAAGSFVADVDRTTMATFVGEPSGGAPNQWGDSQSLSLVRSGLTAHVATSYQEFAPGASRLATMPDVPIEMSAADFFAGRDPALERALR